VAYQPGSEWCKIRVRDEGTGEEYDWRFTPRQGFPAPRTRRRSEAAEMPGHIPGTTAIDWSKVDRPPLAGELQEGDVLPPKDEKLATEEIGHLFMQRVARVSLNHQGMLQLYLSDRDGVFAPTYGIEEPVEFPTDMATFRDRRRRARTGPNDNELDRLVQRAKALADLETLGWYRHKETGVVYRFVRHPFGRGSWPNEVPRYDERRTSPDGGPIIAQPPRAGGMARNAFTFLEKLGPDAIAEVVEEWGVPQPLIDPPRQCNLHGINANGHPQPRLKQHEIDQMRAVAQ